ncbi:MAG: ADP-ribosylglycohydrolase family protein [Bacteroidales bacterium]|jgi:ADP-ribosylglycohydrolase|nr:ADP-ribosylglycohydrolase family protein [Bacteroidales bacterium]
MLGAIIGDIVGSRFEFKNHLSTDFELFTSDCAFTDDTICTVAVAGALLKDISFEKSLLHWCRKYPNPKGGYGGSFGAWVHSENPQPYNSFGNGSAMRVSPCAWLASDRETALEYAQRSAECTHDHPEGIKGAVAVADCIYYALHCNKIKQNIKALASNDYGYNLNMTCYEIRRTNTFNETCQVSVPQAIVCFLESSDFESAIRLAVSIGGDSDTIAAITGSIAEAFYGIPEHITIQALHYLPEDMKSILSNHNTQKP